MFKLQKEMSYICKRGLVVIVAKMLLALLFLELGNQDFMA